MEKILAIDPGNVESGWCLIDAGTLRPLEFGKDVNEKVLLLCGALPFDRAAVEMIASYGMSVGREVFDTCRWIGRFEQHIRQATGRYPDLVFRREEKLHICGDPRAKDTNIRRALVDRFATHDLKNGKGTKDAPDWFYGFRADCWAAYAVGITYIETRGAK